MNKLVFILLLTQTVIGVTFKDCPPGKVWSDVYEGGTCICPSGTCNSESYWDVIGCECVPNCRNGYLWNSLQKRCLCIARYQCEDYQVFDPLDCKCVERCNNNVQCITGTHFDVEKCKCVRNYCSRNIACPKGQYFDDGYCLCMGPIHISEPSCIAKPVPKLGLYNDTQFILTDALFRTSLQSQVEGISSDSRLILITFINVAPFTNSTVEAEIFENVEGKLNTRIQFPLDVFVANGITLGGTSSNDFGYIALADEDQTTSPSTGRIRLFASIPPIESFQVIQLKTKLFPNLITGTLVVGDFTDDNKFLVITYNSDSSLYLVVLSVPTLDIVYIDAFHPPIDVDILLTNGAYIFSISGVNYVILGYAGSTDISTNMTPLWLPPAVFRIFKMNKHGELKAIERVQLPQFPTTFSTRSSGLGSVEILVGMRQSLDTNELTIFQNSSNIRTFIPGDNKNFKRYSFTVMSRNYSDEYYLRLIDDKEFGYGINVGQFYHDTQIYSISSSIGGQVNLPTQLSFVSFYNDRTLIVNEFVTTAGVALPVFSHDGKYMFMSGGNSPRQNDGQPGTFNILSYLVSNP